MVRFMLMFTQNRIPMVKSADKVEAHQLSRRIGFTYNPILIFEVIDGNSLSLSKFFSKEPIVSFTAQKSMFLQILYSIS